MDKEVKKVLGDMFIRGGGLIGFMICQRFLEFLKEYRLKSVCEVSAYTSGAITFSLFLVFGGMVVFISAVLLGGTDFKKLKEKKK